MVLMEWKDHIIKSSKTVSAEGEAGIIVRVEDLSYGIEKIRSGEGCDCEDMEEKSVYESERRTTGLGGVG